MSCAFPPQTLNQPTDEELSVGTPMCAFRMGNQYRAWTRLISFSVKNLRFCRRISIRGEYRE
jgi:hypothetical protein